MIRHDCCSRTKRCALVNVVSAGRRNFGNTATPKGGLPLRGMTVGLIRDSRVVYDVGYTSRGQVLMVNFKVSV